MSLLEKLGIEYSFKDVARKGLPVTLGVMLLAFVIGRGTVPQSDIPTRGKQVETASSLYDAKMYKSQLEEETEKFGFYVNKRMYSAGQIGLYTYEGKPPKYLDFEFMFNLGGKTVQDILLEVNGRRLSVAHTFSKGAVVGHSRLSNYGEREEQYDVRFVVSYDDGIKKEVFVRVRKDEKKND